MQSPLLISPTQSKAARMYLGWTQQDLSKAACVGRSTVSCFEDGDGVRRESVLKIRKAFEVQGIEFLENEGVKRLADDVKIFRGFDSCDDFYEELFRTIRQKGGELLCVVKSQESLLHICGSEDVNDLERLEKLGKCAKIKCLLTGVQAPLIDIPSIEFRMTTNRPISPSCFFGYGNKYASAVRDRDAGILFVVFNLVLAAQQYRTNFLLAWETALPIQAELQQRMRERRICTGL